MFKKSVLLVLLSLGTLSCLGQEASAGWWSHYNTYGELSWSTPSFGSGYRYQVYSVYLFAGARIRIWQLSSEVDSLLYLGDEYGLVASDDDGYGGGAASHSNRDAFINYTVPFSGWYDIYTTSYAPNDFGYYRLWVYVD